MAQTTPIESTDVTPAATSHNALPKISLKTIFAMTFGFFGVNMAFSLQSSKWGGSSKPLVPIPQNSASSSSYHHWPA